MQRSSDRILTTHTGSLPRPRELTRLYSLRARGEAVDAAEIDRAGREAVRGIVAKQREAGIDIGNNGEQQRNSFFLYLKGRLSGLGGSWERPSRGDVDRYPEFRRMWEALNASRTHVSSLGGLPKAIGEVRYLDARLIDDECDHFKAVLDEDRSAFVEPFMCAPSPGIVAMAVRNEHYDTLEAYLAALGAALKVEYEAIVRHGFLLQIDAPDLALERHITYKNQPVAAFVQFRGAGGRRHQPGDRERAARSRAAACVLGQFGNAARRRRAARRYSPGLAAGERGRFRAAVRQSAPRPRVPLLREASARRRPDPGRGRDRQPDQFRRASRGGGGPPRAGRRRRRRSHARARRHRLRLRHLGRLGARRRGRRVGQAREHARRRPLGVAAVVQISLTSAASDFPSLRPKCPRRPRPARRSG